MCGGTGTRLDRGEKPLLPIDGRPMIDRVIDALAAARIDTVYAGVSPNAPRTTARIEGMLDVSTIETPGSGYVPDLERALDRVVPPVMTVAADLPLLDGQTIDAVLDRYSTGSLTVCVPVERKRALGMSVDTTVVGTESLAPTGVNVVGDTDTEEYMIRDDDRLAVNVNRPRDAWIAQTLLEEANDGA
ncbi:NTP transferase domain-containing protein [Halocatena salina]|uniref:NTP transferase domain-containing protein n=2 Tax=Halocatena salina TaxID=2934340 RepID=A0A8U0A845_9EURY|nr:NTP transferase domain-containing protein [Halocatena salina]UPM44087.1 NTP transferase domain-containing protein [Halocatena salina]